MLKFLIIFLMAFLLNFSDQDKKIEDAIKNELNNYPEARLKDIYKNFFQDAYGPGHLIPDTTHAGIYLNEELLEPIADTLKWQAIGPNNDYYRINLQLVKDGILPRNVLLEAMVESAPLARNPDIKEWEKEWENVLKVMDRKGLNFPDFEKDKKEIEELFAKGEYVMHHSEHYMQTYQRHYRILHKTVFFRWKDTYLK
jgi:hypothetical protein